MLGSHIILPGSRDINGHICECTRCGLDKPTSDGVYLGKKWVCGKCWRSKATQKQGALQAIAQENRKTK